MKKLFFVLITFTSTFALSQDVHFIGFRSSMINSTAELAALVPEISFNDVSSLGCSVKTKQIYFSNKPSTEVTFSEPMHLVAQVTIEVSSGVVSSKCAPGVSCPPQKEKCTTESDKNTSREEAISKHWNSNPSFEVISYHRGTVPNPGVTVSN